MIDHKKIQLIADRYRHSRLPIATPTVAVENFKSEMLALDRQIVCGAASEVETQQRVSQTCTAVVDDFRRHIERRHSREETWPPTCSAIRSLTSP